MGSKANAEAKSGNNDKPSAVRVWVEAKLEASLINAMGLTTDVAEKLRKIAAEV